jgi:phosphate-selective porin OprO/OprP
MPSEVKRPHPALGRQILLVVALAALGGSAWGQDAAAPVSNAELLRRIQELEATVRELKKSQSPQPPAPAKPAQPAAPVVQVKTQAGDDSAPAVQPPPPQIPGDGMGQYPGFDPGSAGAEPTGPGRPTRFEQNQSGELQPVPPPGGLPPGQVAGWGNGFYLQSPDQRFVARLTGQIQLDARSYLNPRDTVDIDQFLLRRGRFGVESIMFDFYEFRIMADFGGSQLNAPAPPSTPTPSVTDAYMNVHYWDALQFEFGRFKQPFSYEQLTLDRYIPFMERSMIDQLAPQRDIGIMVHGQNLVDSRVDYAVAVSNGEINGNFDANNNKDVVGRLVIRPFAPNEDSVLRYLGVGLSSTFGDEHQSPVQVSASSSFPEVLRTPLGVPWLTFNTTTVANGARERLSPEFFYFVGPFSFASQYFWQNQQISPSALGIAAPHQTNVLFTGYYVLTTVFLTGERRSGYSRGVDPIRPFDLRRPFACPGAWELAARVSELHVSNNVFTPGIYNLAPAAGNASAATEMTLGLHWYLNRAMLAKFEWEYAWFNDPVTLGPLPLGRLDHQNTLAARFELAF